MESQPQNPEFRNNLENFHPCRTGWTILVVNLTRNICVKLFEFSGPAVQ